MLHFCNSNLFCYFCCTAVATPANEAATCITDVLYNPVIYELVFVAYVLKFSAASAVVDVLQILLLLPVEELRLFLLCCWYAFANIGVEA